jgi:NTE family protein
MNEVVRQQRGQPWRIVHDFVIRPSRDISLIAGAYARKNRIDRQGRASLPTKLLHRIAQSQLVSEADLASYLLFDGEYANELMQMGMEDTHAQRDALLRFFEAPGLEQAA